LLSEASEDDVAQLPDTKQFETLGKPLIIAIECAQCYAT
jgi:hypothetical protein